MSEPVPKPHRLKVWVMDGEKIRLAHDKVCESKGSALRIKREMREAYGAEFSSATVEPSTRG